MILTPRPSAFDLCVAGLLFTPLVPGAMWRGMFFVFYTAFLISLTIGMTPQREYKSIPLSVLTIWSLIGVWLHYEELFPKDTFLNSYINVYMMFEGFIYIFFGVLVLRAIVNYSTNLRFIYILLPFSLVKIGSQMVHTGSLTPVMGLMIGIVVWLLLNKKYIIGLLGVFIGFVTVGINFSWLCMKFACRPLVWRHLLKGMMSLQGEEMLIMGKTVPSIIAKFFHPFVGNGFCDFLWGNLVLVDEDLYGWLYRHNDYFGIGDYLGAVALVCSVAFIIACMVRVGKRPEIIIVLTIGITCFFQMTMFFTGRAAICLVAMAVAIKSSYST